MKIKAVYGMCLFLLVLIGSGCQNQEVKNPEEKEIHEQVEAEEQENVAGEAEEKEENETTADSTIIGPPLPKNLQELETITAGYTEYLSIIDEEDTKKIDELTAGLPDITGSPTTEELDSYYEAILSVFQQDYIGPSELISNMKFQAIGSPEVEDPRYQFKENLNVMVILDASGSMANYEGSQTRMDAAKTAIKNFVKTLPDNANVGLRIYGHEGTGSKEDKARSCNSSELVYSISKYDESNFEQSLAKAQPAGWTPIGLALKEAQKDLASYKGDANTNIIYLVSDGISTCDDDPVGSAKALYNSDITPIVNVIGFNVDNAGQKQLQEVAKATEGTYKHVTDAKGLEDHLNQAADVAEKWKQWKTHQEGWLGYYRIDNYLDISSYHSREFRKWVDEWQQVGFTLTYLYQDKDKFSEESYDYLKHKNTEYHDWIEAEYSKLRKDLEALNDANYAEAVKALEEKYLQHTNSP